MNSRLYRHCRWAWTE